MIGLDATTDMVVKAADVQRWKYLGQLSRGRDVWLCRVSGIPFKVLLIDDLKGLLSSSHVTKFPVKSFDPP